MNPIETNRYRSPRERANAGRAARAITPRSSHAQFEINWANRPHPVSLLEQQAQSRVPSLVPIRYGRMLTSPFAFYRGAALIMASDLATTPNSSLSVQACGDAHLANFGVFASPERSLVFDINDFDETHPGPWEWDLKRLLVSAEIAGQSNSFSGVDRREIVLAGAQEYRFAITEFSQMRQLDIWYSKLDVESLLKNLKKNIKSGEVRAEHLDINKAMNRTSLQALRKFTEIVNGQRRFVSAPPLVAPVRDLTHENLALDFDDFKNIEAAVAEYSQTLSHDRRHLLNQFTFIDLARKVVGVGSVGTRAWMALFEGRDQTDPLFLQVKEAQTSVLEAFTSPTQYANAGERVVAGQRLMQSTSDIFLGWNRVTTTEGTSRDYYIRQLRDWKGSVTVDLMNPTELKLYVRTCAWTLAKAHARTGDSIAISAYLGQGRTFDQAIVEFANEYAQQNLKDFQALEAAVASGRVVAQAG
ncbi:MAG: DUF2252 domain-containing protein [Actinobacteria bacterium]|nr:DUF2252 domain-containing protein [Actinomycetota bacterium]